MAHDFLEYEREGEVRLSVQREIHQPEINIIFPYQALILLQRGESLRTQIDFHFKAVRKEYPQDRKVEDLPQPEMMALFSKYRYEIRKFAILESEEIFFKTFDRDVLTEFTDLPLDLNDSSIPEEAQQKMQKIASILKPRIVTDILLNLRLDFRFWRLIRLFVNNFITDGKFAQEAEKAFLALSWEEQHAVYFAFRRVINRYVSVLYDN